MILPLGTSYPWSHICAVSPKPVVVVFMKDTWMVLIKPLWKKLLLKLVIFDLARSLVNEILFNSCNVKKTMITTAKTCMKMLKLSKVPNNYFSSLPNSSFNLKSGSNLLMISVGCISLNSINCIIYGWNIAALAGYGTTKLCK